MAADSYDVVVVGAGPAGSVAALVLARGGARVALVDKAAFPRDKACGDLVGPRGVQLLADLGVSVPDAGQGSDLLAVGPSGRRSRLPAYPGRAYPGHGIVVPRLAFDHALREAAIAAGAVPVAARVTGLDVDRGRGPGGEPVGGSGGGAGTPGGGPGGQVRGVVTGDGMHLRAEVVIGADGALSPVARLAGMLRSDAALWGFAIRAYLPAEVPLPLLALLDSRPWHIYPGYGWLFPGEDGRANVGIGVGLGPSRDVTSAAGLGLRAEMGRANSGDGRDVAAAGGGGGLRADLVRFCSRLRDWGDIGSGARPGPVVGGWLRMGGTGTPPAMGNVLLAGDAAGLINPLQGEGIAPAMVSAQLAAQAVLAGTDGAGPAYAAALDAAFGHYMTGAAALQRGLLKRPRTASAALRVLTAPGVRRATAGTWSIYWNALATGAQPRPAAWAAHAIESTASRLAGRP